MNITLDIEFGPANDMLCTALRQASILRGIRRKRGRSGSGISPRLEEDIRNMDRIVAHLRKIRRQIENPYIKELQS